MSRSRVDQLRPSSCVGDEAATSAARVRQRSQTGVKPRSSFIQDELLRTLVMVTVCIVWLDLVRDWSHSNKFPPPARLLPFFVLCGGLVGTCRWVGASSEPGTDFEYPQQHPLRYW